MEISKYTLHPWHGIEPMLDADGYVTCYIEVTPTDTVKFEIDKPSGLLKIDRPQKFSNVVPALYGFIPKSFCGERVSNLCMNSTGIKNIIGDGDPLDICVLTSKYIPHGNILLRAKPIGGLRMIDKNEADDKIIAILKDDEVYHTWNDLQDIPTSLIQKLKHYFLTYKNMPGTLPSEQIVSIPEIYSKKEAMQVIENSFADYLKLIG
jgi:inorganic pyrophosphatase